MGFFEDAKDNIKENNVLSTLKSLGVNTDNLSVEKEGAITHISGTVETEGELEKIEKEYGGFLSGSTYKIDIDCTKNYTIVDGDSPWGVAQKFYGDGSKFPILVEMNNGKESYYTGDVIKIPSLRSYVGGMKLQVILSALGFNPGAFDGVVGGKTNQAVKDFQKSNDLNVNGETDRATAQALRSAFRKVEKLEGLVLQIVLKELGHNPGTLDGVVGAKTVSALKEFQSKNSLDETGTADAKTVKMLASRFV